ncbi:MAG: MbnP family protein [Saprospiraceae bacterium]
MNRLAVCFFYLMPLASVAQIGSVQSLSLGVQPVFRGEKIALGEPLTLSGGDTILLHTARIYLGKFVFWKNGQVVFEEKNHYRLLDLEDETTLDLRFDIPENLLFDTMQFDLGVDSLTTVSGVMGGDLDPTKGMFWTWQSGYIQVKLEGHIQGRNDAKPAHSTAFQFHLGGYLPPYQTVQTIKIGRFLQPQHQVSKPSGRWLHLDLAPFFDAVDWAKKRSIMSPGAEAVRLFGVLSTSFSIHEN